MIKARRRYRASFAKSHKSPDWAFSIQNQRHWHAESKLIEKWSIISH